MREQEKKVRVVHHQHEKDGRRYENVEIFGPDNVDKPVHSFPRDYPIGKFPSAYKAAIESLAFFSHLAREVKSKQEADVIEYESNVAGVADEFNQSKLAR